MDASVVGAWCYDEPRAAEALLFLEGADLYAPPLLAYELANIARRKAAVYPGKVDGLITALQQALALPIHPQEVDHAAVLRIALDSNLTTYDASYLYLSRLMGAPLVTFDERLRRAAQGV